MPKAEIDFIDMAISYGWRSVEGDTLGIKEKTLSLDPGAKSYSRLPKVPPGDSNGGNAGERLLGRGTDRDLHLRMPRSGGGTPADLNFRLAFL